jgi:hypothetical protein
MGKYRGRGPDLELHEQIYKLRVLKDMSINETAKHYGFNISFNFLPALNVGLFEAAI